MHHSKVPLYDVYYDTLCLGINACVVAPKGCSYNMLSFEIHCLKQQ